MAGGTRSHWIREQQMIASLNKVCFLCAQQCRAIAAACLRLQRDPIYEDVLGGDAFRLSLVAKRLLEESVKVHGAQVLQLAVSRRLLLQIMERREVVVWLARNHPEALSILMNAADFDGLGLGDFEVAPMPSRPRKRRKRGI